MSEVVNVRVCNIRPKYRDLHDWCQDCDNVYIGRKGIVFIDQGAGKQRFPKADSIWANPFKIGRDGSAEQVVAKYREYITERLAEEEDLRRELELLRGKVLGCWCKPEPCHGDVLADLLQAL